MKIDTEWKNQLEGSLDHFLQLTPLIINTLNRSDFPLTGGLYMFSRLDDKECIYIGKSGNLRNRVFDAHLKGNGKSSFRNALLGLKKTRKHAAVTTEETLDDYIKTNYILRFQEVTDILYRGCLEDYANAVLKPEYSVSLSMK
ncbi:GIY-YIG nuclease family protein [Bacillus sp. FJAT-28004]|uniref:GIY-YIG nuclease family protein n=1 Tax=Bacillus sp. FJAT-28004 TaxID=1679165 RepID=UPI0006B607F8|nr:GIY-YIG nuclease family protein [Bacillus sp. FJAT-28004]